MSNAKIRRPALPRPGRYALASTRCPAPTVGTTTAPAPAGCTGTDWPPTTPWERYAAERRAGIRVPPSVTTWRAADVERQAAAERMSREPREVVS